MIKLPKTPIIYLIVNIEMQRIKDTDNVDNLNKLSQILESI